MAAPPTVVLDGASLAALRTRRGLTFVDVEILSRQQGGRGISYDTVARAERGEPIRRLSAGIIAAALEVDLDALLAKEPAA